MLSTILEQLTKHTKRKQAEKFTSHQAQYKEMLKAAARGVQVDIEALAILLDVLGKTPGDFESDARVFGERLRNAELVAKQPEIQKKIATADKKREALEAELQDVKAKLLPQIDSLRSQVAALEVELNLCDGALRYLINSVMDTSILEREEELCDQALDLMEMIAEKDARLQELKAERTKAENSIQQLTFRPQYPVDMANAKNALAYATANLESVQRERDELETKLHSIQNEREKVFKERLVP